MKTVLLPAQNRKDVKDLPDEVKEGLEIIHVRYVRFATFHHSKTTFILQVHMWNVANIFRVTRHATATSGRPSSTSGPMFAGPASEVSQ